MKKFISLLLVLSLVFCFAACGGNETPVGNDDNSVVNNEVDNSDENNTITGNKEITLEDLENAPVSPESDFEVLDVEGGVSVAYFGDDEIVVIPETIGGKKVVEISRRGFVNADTVRAVKLADTIEVVGENAFHAVDALEIIVAGVNLKKVEDYAFTNCPKLRCLELNEGIEYIGGCAIFSDPCLKEFYIPGSVKEIGSILPEEDAVVICEAGSIAENYCKGLGCNYRLK